MQVNYESVIRQSFGARFNATKHDEILAQRLKSGQLEMAPHGSWALPSKPQWTENPFADNNWQFQYHSLRWLDPLRRVAMREDAEAKALWSSIVQSWLQVNPPGASPSKWAWIDMGDALRTFELTFALSLFREENNWLIEAVHEHADWLLDEDNLGHGNHAFHQHQALFVASNALNLTDHRDVSIQRLGAMLESSYDDQGVNEEGSIGYQELNFHWWTEALERLDLEGVRRPNGCEKLELAPISLAHATQPNGEYVRLGDMDGGGPRQLTSPGTLYMSTAGREGVPPEQLIARFERGYIFGRSGWGETERDFEKETFFSLSYGKQDKIHGHQDGLSVTYFSSGQPWLIDTGKFTYGSHPMRSYVLSRAGHNSLTVLGSKYDRTHEVKMTSENESARHYEASFRDAGYANVVITRKVVYSKTGEYLVVLDAVSAKAIVDVQQRWHFAPEVEATFDGAYLNLSSESAEIGMQWLGSSGTLSRVRGSDEPFEGWTSTGWRKKSPTTLISATRSGTQISFKTVIGAKANSRNSVRNISGIGYEISVPTRFGIEYVLVSKSGVKISDSPFSEADARYSVNGAGSGVDDDGGVKTTDELRQIVTSVFEDLLNSPNSSAKRHSLLQANSELMEIRRRTATSEGFLEASLIDIAGEGADDIPFLSDSIRRRRPLISWPGGPSIEDTSGEIRTYSSVGEAGISAEFCGVQTVRLGPLTLAALSKSAGGDTLHVGFHGALDRTKYSLPRFERTQGFSDLGDSYLLFADPTLDLDPTMTLGWYLGVERLDLHREIADFVMSRMEAGGFTKVVLSGSSGGGYAALQVASMIPDSLAVVFNPQTRIKSYFTRFADRALEAVFTQPKELGSELSIRTDLSERYKAENGSTRVYYVQNLGDQHHYKNHFIPFKESLDSMSHIRLKTVLVDWGNGHKTPKNDVYAEHVIEAQAVNW